MKLRNQLLLIFSFVSTFYLFRLIQTELTWLKSRKSSKNFLSKNKSYLQSISIGCSFSPEEMESKGFNHEETLKGLQFLVEELQMKEIRLGIRWNRVESIEGVINLDYYKPYLKYCFDNKVSICLNIGPIKTFRWPEEHIPAFVIGNQKTKTVFQHNEIAIQGLRYIEELMQLLKIEFTSEQLQYVKVIQPENEPFNRMGIFGFKMSDNYIKKLVFIIHEHFPEAKILLNSAGRFQLRQIIRIFRKILKRKPELENKLIAGYDYYYKTVNRDKLFLSKYLDSIDFSIPFDVPIKKLHELSEELGFEIEVTEAQIEPWGETYPEVGNSSSDFKFMILRCMKILSGQTCGKRVIRLWGIEHFLEQIFKKDLTKEHKEIIGMVQSVNNY